MSHPTQAFSVGTPRTRRVVKVQLRLPAAAAALSTGRYPEHSLDGRRCRAFGSGGASSVA
jgi:hypothetical protein